MNTRCAACDHPATDVTPRGTDRYLTVCAYCLGGDYPLETQWVCNTCYTRFRQQHDDCPVRRHSRPAPWWLACK